jgi:hypothetical protein
VIARAAFLRLVAAERPLPSTANRELKEVTNMFGVRFDHARVSEASLQSFVAPTNKAPDKQK